MKILSIDPSSTSMGWAIIDSNTETKKACVEQYGLITPPKDYINIIKEEISRSKTTTGNGFNIVYNELYNIIHTYNPDICIVESYVARGRNKKGICLVPQVIAIIQLLMYDYNKTEVMLYPTINWRRAFYNSKIKDDVKKILLREKWIKDRKLVMDTYEAIAIGIAYHFLINDCIESVSVKTKTSRRSKNHRKSNKKKRIYKTPRSTKSSNIRKKRSVHERDPY